jgi:hypothetical protein
MVIGDAGDETGVDWFSITKQIRNALWYPISQTFCYTKVRLVLGVVVLWFWIFLVSFTLSLPIPPRQQANVLLATTNQSCSPK